MLYTKHRLEYAHLSDGVVRIKPTAETQAHYNSLGHPEWGTPDTLANFTGSPLRLKEYIRGETDYRRDKWNPCEHYKCSFDPGLVNNMYFLWCSPTKVTPSRWWEGLAQTKYLINTVYDYMNPVLQGPVLFVPRSDGGFVPPPPGLNTLIQRSLNAMMPQVKSNLSLINSLIELRDFRSLPRTLDKLQHTVSRLGPGLFDMAKRLFSKRSKVRRTFLNSYGLTLNEVAKSSANGYLQAQFNIGPLLSDIAGIYQTVSRIEKIIRDLINRQGRIQRRHFTFRWTPYKTEFPVIETVWNDGYDTSFNTVGGESLYYGTSDNIELTSYIPASPAIFHAEMEYNYNYTSAQVEHARLLGILDALGINLNPAIIWNAIPWTFVVDWVFGISRWLDQRKVLNLRPEINITRYLWSWSYSRTIRRQISSDNIRTGGFGQQILPPVQESIYRRDVKLPDISSLVMSGLSPKEISLGVALAKTRGRHRHNRGR